MKITKKAVGSTNSVAFTVKKGGLFVINKKPDLKTETMDEFDEQ